MADNLAGSRGIGKTRLRVCADASGLSMRQVSLANPFHFNNYARGRMV